MAFRIVALCILAVSSLLNVKCSSNSSNKEVLRPCHLSGEDLFLTSIINGSFNPSMNCFSVWIEQDNPCHISLENGILHVDHSDDDSSLMVFKASPFAEPQIVHSFTTFDHSCDLVFLFPAEYTSLKTFFESAQLWEFWMGNTRLTRLGDFFELAYNVQILYFSEHCLDPVTEDIECTKLEVSKIENIENDSKYSSHSHTDSVIEFVPTQLRSLVSLAVVPVEEVGLVANAILSTGISMNGELHIQLLKKALIQWSHDLVSDRSSAIRVLKDHVMYKQDEFYKILIDMMSRNFSSADFWANKSSKGDTIAASLLEESMLALAVSEHSSVLLDSMRVVELVKTMTKMGREYQKYETTREAKILVRLFNGSSVEHLKSWMTESVIECMIDWMSLYNGARFFVLFSNSPIYSLSANWSRVRRRQSSLPSYSKEIILHNMVDQFIVLASQLINPESAKNAACYYSVHGKLKTRMIRSVETFKLCNSFENAHNLVTLLSDIKIYSVSVSFGLLRWLCTNDHPSKYTFLLNNLPTEIGHNQLAETNRDESVNTLLLLLLAQRAPLTVRKVLKESISKSHKNHWIVQRLLQDVSAVPSDESATLFLNIRLLCQYIHNQSRLQHKMVPDHPCVTMYSHQCTGLWTEGSQATIFESTIQEMDNAEDIITGTIFLDPNDYPNYLVIHVGYDNKVRVYSNSASMAVTLNILSSSGVGLYPQVEHGTEISLTGNCSILIMNTLGPTEEIDYKILQGYFYILEQSDVTLKRLFTTHLMRIFKADLVMLVENR